MTITIFIVLITSIISLSILNKPELIMKWSHYPFAEKRQKQWYRLLTSGFVHGSLFHLFVNMFVLWAFGEYIERRFIEINGPIAGKVVYVLFYLFMIILANLPNYARYQDNGAYSSIGASGATSAVVFSYILFEPMSLLELYFFIPIPAIVFGILYLWYSNWASRKLNDRIDHDAHFYGAIGGFLFTLFMKWDLIYAFIDKIMSVF